MAAPPMNGREQHPPPRYQHQGLPSISSLTNGLPPTQQISPEQQSATDFRPDSVMWPGSQNQSKHTSANSGLHVSTLLNPDDSPHRSSVPGTPLSARMPYSGQSYSSQPTSGTLPSINQGFQDPGNRDSQASMESRRSSVDSRMHQGFNSLYINNPTSPYESANTSQVSLAASLRRPIGGPMSPLGSRSAIRSHPPGPRIAPPIMPIGRAPGQPDPTAAKPTQGYAWAFPDTVPEETGRSDSDDESSVGPSGVSRNNSLAASVRSSIFSNDSHIPGQRRFDDDPATTHHHSMQHRAVQNVQAETLAQQAAGNYSRTPELRVSHKLAERKRRSEMKDLFEDLNKAVPANGGSKASKWEILTKAIEHIRNIAQNEQRLQHECSSLRKDMDYARDTQKENEMLKTEVQVMQQHLRRLDPNNTHIYGQFTNSLNQSHPPQPPLTNGNSGISLPPLNPPREQPNGHHDRYGGPPAAAPMQGVEYGYGGR